MENILFTIDLSLVVIAILAAIFLYNVMSKRRKPRPVRSERPRSETLRPPMVHILTLQPAENGRWQLRDEEGNLPGALRVRRGDTVIWRTPDTDAYFQFPRLELFEELEREWTTEIGKNSELKLTVSESACGGLHVYAVFCNVKEPERREFGYAEGGSPPRMIIEEY